jgi:acyl-CoA thioesterase I
MEYAELRIENATAGDRETRMTRPMATARRLLSIPALLILACGAVAGESSQLVTRLEAGKPQTVVTYGTSLTAGGAWVNQLRDALKAKYPGLATVTNSGQGGMWSKWGVDNLEARVIQKKPDTVFIEFAINDAFLEYKTSVEDAQGNLTRMIDRLLQAKPETEIILMTMNPPIGVHLERRPRIEDYYAMYREVAKARKLRLIDHHVAWKRILDTDKDLFNKLVPDGIHPGPEGCQKVITPSILAALGLKSDK